LDIVVVNKSYVKKKKKDLGDDNKNQGLTRLRITNKNKQYQELQFTE
jgi:hypothetical protein